MYVKKRNGKEEKVQFDKILSRISKLAYGLNTDYVDPVYITQKVIITEQRRLLAKYGKPRLKDA